MPRKSKSEGDGGRKAITGPDTLDRWGKESPIQHRALLLFAMQKGDTARGILGRNTSAVCRAVARSGPTVREWANKRRWYERTVAHGEDAQFFAIELYKAYYMKMHGKREMPEIAHLVSIPISDDPDAPAPRREVEREARDLLKRIMPPPPSKEIQKEVKDAVEARKKRMLDQNQTFMSIAYKALDYFDQQIAKGAVRVTIKDLGALHDLVVRLEREETQIKNPDLISQDALSITDSVRVKIAKETGGDVMHAVLDDLEEMVLVVRHIVNPRQVAEVFAAMPDVIDAEEAAG